MAKVKKIKGHILKCLKTKKKYQKWMPYLLPAIPKITESRRESNHHLWNIYKHFTSHFSLFPLLYI